MTNTPNTSIDEFRKSCWERLGWLSEIAARESDRFLRNDLVDRMVHEASCIAASLSSPGEEDEAANVVIKIVAKMLAWARGPSSVPMLAA